MENVKPFSCFRCNVHNEMIKDDTPSVDELGTPFSIGEFFSEYVDVTVIPATDEVDDNITISK